MHRSGKFLRLWRLDMPLGELAPDAQLVLDRTQAERDAEARLHRVVLPPVVVCVEELFEPLQKLKVILKAALYQLVHRDDLEWGEEDTKDNAAMPAF